MARPGITYNEVAAVIDGIIAAGDVPTIQKIRAKLGTGSPNTIHRHLTAWRESAPPVERKAPELPADLQAALVREFERQAAEIRAEFEAKLVAAQTEASELADTGEGLETDMAELTERNQSLTNESQRLEALVDERAKEIHKLETELTNAREAAEKVRIQLAQALNKTETQSEQITAQQGRISSLEAYLDEANHAKVTAQQTTAVGEAKLEAAAREIGQQAQQIEQLRKDIADQKAYFETRLAEQITDARRRDQTFEVQIKDLRGDYQQRIDELKAAAQAEIAALRKPALKKKPKRTPKTMETENEKQKIT